MTEQHLALSAVGEAPLRSFAEIAATTRHFFERLRAIHPEFRFWESMGESRYENLDPQWNELEAHLRRMARPRKRDRAGFSDLDAKGDVTAQTRSVRGFTFDWFTGDAAGGPADGQNQARRDIVEMRLTAADDDYASQITGAPHGRKNARDLAVLFDHAGIARERLRVVFTPKLPCPTAASMPGSVH